MKRKLFCIALALVLILGSVTVILGRSEYSIRANGASSGLNKTSVTLVESQTCTLTLSSSSKTVKWSSSNSGIASVSSKGVVTAKSAGEAEIYAKVGILLYKCKVKVLKAMVVNYMVKGEEISFGMPGVSAVSWSSSDSSVATVSSAGIVTAKGKGTASIYGKVGNTTYQKVVTVEEPKLSKSSLTLTKGGTYILSVKNTAQTPVWSTSNRSVATVTVKGKVVAKGSGTAYIYAKIGTKKLKCTVQVGLKTIKVGINAEYPDFEYINDNGKYEGIDIDIINKVASENGYQAEFYDMEFDNLLPALKNGEIDCAISALAVTAEAKRNADFSISYYTPNQAIVVAKDSKIKSLSSLKKKQVAVVENYGNGYELMDNGIDYDEYSTFAKAKKAMDNGECDAIIIEKTLADYYASKYSGLMVVTDERSFGAENYGVAVKKNNTRLLKLINTSLEKMKKDGSIVTIRLKYK